MKKIVSLFLAAGLLFSLSAPVWAETAGDKLPPENGVTVQEPAESEPGTAEPAPEAPADEPGSPTQQPAETEDNGADGAAESEPEPASSAPASPEQPQEEAAGPQAEAPQSAGVVASGALSDSVSWVLTDDGVLTISGTGSMGSASPWEDYAGQITELRVEEGITSVYATSLLKSLVRCSIPASARFVSFSYYLPNLEEILAADGNPLYYSLDGVLFEQGTRHDYNNEDGTYGPWYDYNSLIRYPAAKSGSSYAVPDGVTEIGSDAFSYTKNLRSVTLPDSVTKIQSAAFRRSSQLEHIDLGNGMQSIGFQAFIDCRNLKALHFPASLTELDKGGSSINTLQSFFGCYSMEEFTVDEANPAFCAVDGVLFNKDQTTLVAYPLGRKAETYTVPSSVTTIGSYAFCIQKGLRTLAIPATVTTIGRTAIWYEDLMEGSTDVTTITDIYFGGTEEQWVAAGGATNSQNYNETMYLGKIVVHFGTTEIPAVPDQPGHEHTWGAWETVTEPTVGGEGMRRRTCTVCGESESEILPALAPEATPAPGGDHTVTDTGAAAADPVSTGDSAPVAGYTVLAAASLLGSVILRRRRAGSR